MGENRPQFAGMNAFWYVDGQTYPRPTGEQWLAVTPLQYRKLASWAEGDFTDDRAGG